MNYIIAIIKPHLLDDVRDALSGAGVNGLTVSEVQGYGRQKGQAEIYRGAEYQISFRPKVKIEVAVAKDMTPAVLEAIEASAKTGSIGDGKIFVLETSQAIRIRTGESGVDAL